MAIKLNVNGKALSADVDEDTPLLWVLRDSLGIVGPKYGCGIGACGACTVHVDGQPMRSCQIPVSSLGAAKITTIEGVGASSVGKKVQAAWSELDVAQCGYCQAGQIMSATALLTEKPKPTDADIDEAMEKDPVGKKIQAAWSELDVAQCGYCQAGQIMSATALLKQKPKPTDEDINSAMAGNICRCATYVRIRRAIKRASGQQEA